MWLIMDVYYKQENCQVLNIKFWMKIQAKHLNEKILSSSLKINRWIHWEESNNYYFPQFKLFELTLWTEILDYCYYLSRHSQNLRNFPFQDTGTIQPYHFTFHTKYSGILRVNGKQLTLIKRTLKTQPKHEI